MTAFPVFAVASHIEPAFDGVVEFHIMPRTLGLRLKFNQLYEAFKPFIDTTNTLEDTMIITLAAVLTYTEKVCFTPQAQTIPGLQTFIPFWDWRKGCRFEDLIANAEQIVNWRKQYAPDVLMDTWVTAHNKGQENAFAAPRELQPVGKLTVGELSDPNS